MITINERNLGNFSPDAGRAAVAFLQGKGYPVAYGPFTAHGVARGLVSNRHWRKAQDIAATTPTLRNLEDLPYSEQITILTDICEYLTDKYLCPNLFPEVAQ